MSEGKAILDFESPYFFGASGSSTVWFMWSLLCIVPVLYVLARKEVNPPESDADNAMLPRPASTGSILSGAADGPRKNTLVRHAEAPEGPELAEGGNVGAGVIFDSGVRTGTKRNKSKRTVTLQTPRARDVQDRASESSGTVFHFSNVNGGAESITD